MSANSEIKNSKIKKMEIEKIELEKTCVQCHISQPLYNFDKHVNTKDRLKNRCKVCESIYNRKRYLAQAKKEVKMIEKRVKKWEEKYTDKKDAEIRSD